MGKFPVSLLYVLLFRYGACDINIHNPRGSNDRLNEESRARANGNRMFNSQNNARGGHNVGVQPLYFYSGSNLRIEWATQHSCGDENNNCEIIIQYMCGENVRNGRTTNTPPITHTACRGRDCDTDERFGMHESLRHFQKCQTRERNKGLYTATQTLRKSARSTRQNNEGERYGYECQEERDYYPYWASSPWKDIVIFTNNPGRCPYYQQNSQNVKGRFECDFGDEFWRNAKRRHPVRLYLSKEECEWSSVTIANRTFHGKWIWRRPHRLPPPECLKTPWSRGNHQGNTIGGQFMRYDWRIPELEDDDQNCVIRIRYNVSTNDFDTWSTDSASNENQPDVIWKRFGLNERDARKRQYVFRNNPNLEVFPSDMKKKFRLRLAIDTAKYGRTFQDRTHVFRVLRRPKHLRGKVIHNVNVRGKRGSIVQVYPSTVYDFVPNKLLANKGDFVHFQWTGSDSNPRMNDGRGEVKTDRSNIVQLAYKSFGPARKRISLATNYPHKTPNFLGMGWKTTDDLAFLERCAGSDPLLDGRSAYFDSSPKMLNSSGAYFYMSTRNNDFSKLTQKATIIVGEGSLTKRDRGSYYSGFQRVTAGGHLCQRWDEQFPHKHPFRPAKYRRSNLESNFCRNPIPNRRTRPWCYTTNRRVVWQYCDIVDEIPGRIKRSIDEETYVFPQTDLDFP